MEYVTCLAAAAAVDTVSGVCLHLKKAITTTVGSESLRYLEKEQMEDGADDQVKNTNNIGN